MIDDLRHFRAEDYYRRPSAFDLMTKNDAGWFFFLLLAVALVLDFLGYLA